MPIEAEIILKSQGPEPCPVLITFRTNFHKFILAERNRHRMFSFSDRSARAVPTPRLIKEMKSDPAMPVEFKKSIPGMMHGGEVLEGVELSVARVRWWNHSEHAIRMAEWGLADNEARETLNRHLDQFTYTHSIWTGCEAGYMNFFGLRLDRHAQPEIRVLAEKMWAAWNESKPAQKLKPGEWHLPLCDDVQGKWCTEQDDAKLVSAARCANTSYRSWESDKILGIEECLNLANRLLKSRHYSPFEHQATPDKISKRYNALDGQLDYEGWINKTLHGNLPGYIQYRKTLPGEAVAELPEEYRK